MPRTARADLGGVCYHVLNRGNGRAEVFHKPEDCEAFLRLIPLACERLPLEVLGTEQEDIQPAPDVGRAKVRGISSKGVSRCYRYFLAASRIFPQRSSVWPLFTQIQTVFPRKMSSSLGQLAHDVRNS